MLVVIPQTDPESNPEAAPDWEWLPPQCPACGQGIVIGHGRRRKQAHGERRTSILVRRGISKCCGRTCTILPALVAAWHTVQFGDPPAKLCMLYVRRGVGRGRS